MDPEAVEGQNQAEQDGYKLYRRRWSIMFAMFSVGLVIASHKSIICIADISNEHMSMTMDDYAIMMQVGPYTSLVSVLVLARIMERFGLRRMVSWAPRFRIQVRPVTILM